MERALTDELARDAELVWGDYFLLEALLRRRGGSPR
jgi:hypothetical protein